MEDLALNRAFWLDRPTLVTGGTGLVGSWLVRRLIEAGADVVCLVRDWVPQSELVRARWIEQVKVVRGDVRDREALERALGEYEIDTVIHLAAQTIVTIADRNPISTFETNIQGTWNLLEACRRSPRVKQIVTASSDKAYGGQTTLPYSESTPLQGQHPYDVSKSAGDLIANTYAVSGLRSHHRCGNSTAGRPELNRIIPGTIRSVLRGQPLSSARHGRPGLLLRRRRSRGARAAGQQLADRPELKTSFNFSNELR
jgi:CDP-glucose 4,6-dehydratase